MLTSLLAAASIAASVHAPAGDFGFEPQGKVGALVALAWQDKDKDKQEQRHQEDLKKDVEMGKDYSKEVEKELRVSKNEEMIARVNRIGGELAAIANVTNAKALWGDKRLNPFQYTFKVVEGKDVNAFSLPGGIVYVYEGLLNYVQSDDELAGVLAHEIAHAAFRHVPTLQREQNKMIVLQIPLILAGILTGSNAALGALEVGTLAGQAMASGWSVKAEEAADYGGFQFLLKSKYNPTGMLTFMERLAADDNNDPSRKIDWGIYRTHPPSEERASTLTREMNEANIPIRRSKVTTAYRTQIRPGESGAVEAWFNGKKIYTFRGTDALKRADDAAIRLDEFFDQTPDLYMVKTDPTTGAVLGNGKVLIQTLPEDADPGKTTPEQQANEASKSVKTAVYSLAYHIWGVKSSVVGNTSST